MQLNVIPQWNTLNAINTVEIPIRTILSRLRPRHWKSLKISMKTNRTWLKFKLEVVSLCAGIDMLIEIREDLAGSATVRHRKVTTPKVMITIGILPRMLMMMMKRERGEWLGFDGWWFLIFENYFNRFIFSFFLLMIPPFH